MTKTMISEKLNKLKALPVELQLHILHFVNCDINLFVYSVILHMIGSMHFDMSYNEVFSNFKLFKQLIVYLKNMNYMFSLLTIHYLDLYLQNIQILYQKNNHKFYFCYMLKEFYCCIHMNCIVRTSKNHDFRQTKRYDT